MQIKLIFFSLCLLPVIAHSGSIARFECKEKLEIENGIVCKEPTYKLLGTNYYLNVRTHDGEKYIDTPQPIFDRICIELLGDPQAKYVIYKNVYHEIDFQLLIDVGFNGEMKIDNSRDSNDSYPLNYRKVEINTLEYVICEKGSISANNIASSDEEESSVSPEQVIAPEEVVSTKGQ